MRDALPTLLFACLMGCAGQCADPGGEGAGPDGVEVPAAVPEPVAPGVWAVDPVTFGDGLRGLDAIVADADVVGFGEGHHFSAGLERAMGAAFEHLVREHGFRVMALEYPWGSVAAVDAQLQGCRTGGEVTPPDWTELWTGGPDAMLAFSCRWNAEHPDDPVRWVGMDVQEPGADIRVLAKALPGVAEVETARQNCFGARFASSAELRAHGEATGFATPPESEHVACLEALDALEPKVAEGWPALALMAMRTHERSQRVLMAEGDPAGAQDIRDRGMRAMLDARVAEVAPEGAKVVVWGHLMHIAANSPDILGTPDEPEKRMVQQGMTSVGTLLARDPEVRYAAIGFVASTLHSRFGAAVTRVAPDRPESVEAWLGTLGPDALVVDVKAALPDGERRIVNDDWMVPAEQVAGLVWLREAEAR